MDLEKVRIKSNEMLKKLVDNLDLDGEYYISVNYTPIIFGNKGANRFLTARSKELEKFLDDNKVDKKRKEFLLDRDLIIINRIYKNTPNDEDLYVTLIHEQLHANRMLLLNGEHNKDNRTSYYADSLQDIIKVHENYSNQLDYYKYEEKMQEQRNIDEALIETMAITAYLLYKKNTNNIMDIIKYINKRSTDDDIISITNIILRHNDLELLRWIIDPLSYEMYDVNYDFFNNYINNEDKEDLERIKKFDYGTDDIINKSLGK